MTLISRSPESPENFSELLEQLNALEPAIPFIQTYPDEVQGGFESAEPALRAMLLATPGARFWAGIGVGAVKAPRFAAALGAISTPECSGDALDFSRLAVEQAQTGSPARGIVVLGHHRAFSEQATGLARLIFRVASERTDAENRVLSLIVPGVRGQQKAVAQALGISAQAVSKTLVRSYYHEQEAALPALAEILINLDQDS